MKQNFIFDVTDSAVLRIAELIRINSQKNILRVSVEGGGCSGFSYKYEFTDIVNHNDFMIQREEAKIIIDDLSQQFLQGASLDFIRTLGSSYFNISNPNAKNKCGCGTSFTVV